MARTDNDQLSAPKKKSVNKHTNEQKDDKQEPLLLFEADLKVPALSSSSAGPKGSTVRRVLHGLSRAQTDR